MLGVLRTRRRPNWRLNWEPMSSALAGRPGGSVRLHAKGGHQRSTPRRDGAPSAAEKGRIEARGPLPVLQPETRAGDEGRPGVQEACEACSARDYRSAEEREQRCPIERGMSIAAIGPQVGIDMLGAWRICWPEAPQNVSLYDALEVLIHVDPMI